MWGTVSKAVQKTLKIRLLPVSKGDKALTHCLSKDYTTLLREALDIVVRSDVRSRRRAHELCYKRLRERYPHLHNTYVEEAYKRTLSMYRSYRRLLGKWMKHKYGKPPSPPSLEANRVVDLHIDTLRVEERNGFKILRLSVGNGEHARFVMLI